MKVGEEHATAPAGDTACPPPQEFASGRYAVKRVLGAGGQKVVYLVHDNTLDRDCALALISSDGLRPDDAVRMRREAQALARVDAHAHVVTVFDLGEERGRPFIVCEYVPGGDLAGELDREGGSLPPARAVTVARDVLHALAFVHAHGIVHRDIKPGNVWLAADGGVKLGDFGLALTADRSRMTADGAIMGTPAYAAPEQLQGMAVDGRADLYALGCVLYEMLSGRPPFMGSVVSVISQHLHAAPARTSSHNPDVPDLLDGFVLRLLAKSPDGRPASAESALAELDEAAVGIEPASPARPIPVRPISATARSGDDIAATAQALPGVSSVPSGGVVVAAASRPPSPQRRAPVALAGVVLASLAALAVGLTTSRGPTAPPPVARAPIALRAAAAAPVAAPPGVVPEAAPAPPTSMRRLVVVATHEPTEAVDSALAWALASRLVEEIDHYREFRPVSHAGTLAARIAVLGDATAVPDEVRAASIAQRVGADTVAALSVARAAGGLTVAIHVFAAGDPADGVSSMRERLRPGDLDGDGPARLAAKLVTALSRQWHRESLTDEATNGAPRHMRFDAWQTYNLAEQYCISGRYDRCEAIARQALTADPDNALFHAILGCSLSYQGRDAEATAEVMRAWSLRDTLASRRDRAVVEQDHLWLEAVHAQQRGDEPAAVALGQRILALDLDLARTWRDPWGYLYGAAVSQYLLHNVSQARALYAEGRRLAPSLFPPYHEEAKLLHGDGTNPAYDREAARLLWTFITCNPTSELIELARSDVNTWGLVRPAGELPCPQPTL